jgi:Tol biopolymer transport system component
MRAALVLVAACGRVGFDPLGVEDGPSASDAPMTACPSWGTPTPLDTLNTGDGESEPALSPDTTRLVFASNRSGVDRLYVAMRAGAVFSPPSVIPSLDSGMGDGGPAWSVDGTRLYFSSFRGGPLGLYQAAFDNGTFSNPTRVAGLEALNESLAPSVRTDELEMFFSSRLPPSQIEYATRATTNAAWVSRGNVPELVASVDHGYPGISSDGLTLYFEVERTGSGFFIARTHRTSFSSPFGPVEPVAELDASGSHGDPQPSFDGMEMFFASDRRDPGNFDLYVAACL